MLSAALLCHEHISTSEILKTFKASVFNKLWHKLQMFETWRRHIDLALRLPNDDDDDVQLGLEPNPSFSIDSFEASSFTTRPSTRREPIAASPLVS